MGMGVYILIGHEPLEIDDLNVDTLRAAMEQFNDIAVRRVGRDEFGDVCVSTVFLSFDHNYFDEGPPLLFETMVFGGEYAESREWYATWEEAEQGHREWVERVRIYEEVAHDSGAAGTRGTGDETA
jgi:hypothetical protein